MNGWHSWLALIGGILAIAGQWWTGYWLALIGGILAAISGLAAMMNK